MKNKHFSLCGKLPLFLAATAACYTPVALASGYHFGTQSVSSQSTANASAAEAADASTIYYNAAGMSKLDGTNFSINANFVAPSAKYSNASANYPDGSPIAGQTSGKISKDLVVVPHVYATHQLSEQWTLGLGVYVPFATETEYQYDSVLRYNVNKTGLTAIDINPTAAFKINDNHSISAGLLLQYATAELRQFANLGRLAALPNGIDSYAEVEGDDWGIGYTLSYLWDVNDDVRLGANFRSKVDHHLEGSAKWKTAHPAYADPSLLGAIRGAGYAESEDANVDIKTPESLSVHGMFKINDKWTAFADATWTRHSRFNKLRINYENPKVVANVARQTTGCANAACTAVLADHTLLLPNWQDTYKLSIGALYQYSEPLQLRFGIAYDQSPVKSADYRLSTIPDNDRIWLSMGAKYDFNAHSSINIAYSYIHIQNAKANVNGWCGSLNPVANNCVSSRTDGSADFKGHANMLSIQYNYKF